MLRIFTSCKNPRTWVPEASMLTTRPPKPSWLVISCELFRDKLWSYLYWIKGFLWCRFCWIIILKFFVTSCLWGILWVVTRKCGVDQYHLQLYGLDWLIYGVLRSVFIDVMWIELWLVYQLLWVIAGVFTLGRLHCLRMWAYVSLWRRNFLLNFSTLCI
jgi:hypothetical protein